MLLQRVESLRRVESFRREELFRKVESLEMDGYVEYVE